jgi:hypothetical protein
LLLLVTHKTKAFRKCTRLPDEIRKIKASMVWTQKSEHRNKEVHLTLKMVYAGIKRVFLYT